MSGSPRSRRGSASRSALAGLAVLLALTSASPARAAERKRVTTAELAEEGLEDPRLRELPRRHRFRLALMTDYVRATRACNSNATRCTRFHFVPLVLDFAYQLQFLRYAMLRPSLGFGANVGNSRNAMPAILQPGIHAGYQGKLLGVAFGYSYILVFPPRANADDGLGGLGQPLLWNNHVVAGELSLTTKIDRGALNLGLRVGGMKTHLMHFDIDRVRWFPVLTITAGWFFGPRKRGSGALPAAKQSP
ncbi:MAG: hypothetical protein KC420_10090 [Myxococcales bacterium]|nr:hypothetical protein [Myxococcales bacterium]MCB9567600.1 hypothetical protein [Myxococcales bacterium]MCB9702585.1 hypothetical protein [Myxococcales bacterium]